MSIYKKAVGFTPDKYASNANSQRESLPESGIKPTNQELLLQIRDYLWKCELERIHGTKNMPLFPMIFDENGCTGEPMQLMRVCNREKVKDGETIQNPNFGRFFVARKVAAVDDDGRVMLNDKGWPIMDLADFCWLNETMYARHGALKAAAPMLEGLLLKKYGVHVTDDQFWPGPEVLSKLV